MAVVVSLVPLELALHARQLQGVYDATPGYWSLYSLPGCPPDQAAKDLRAAGEDEGRTILGIVRRLDARTAEAGGELIGLIDLRLGWPEMNLVYIGMLMVAERFQRQGIGTQAWSLLKPWLASAASMTAVRLGVEQFNHRAQLFWQAQGFGFTGESNRLYVAQRFVRLLYMELILRRD